MLHINESSSSKWLVVFSHSIATFSNAIGFGLYFTNLNIFSQYYSVSEQDISNSFYIGLVLEVLFFLPAIILIDWRLDYSILCASFLTAATYWIQYIAKNNFIVVIITFVLVTFGQSLLLPMSPFLAERWFPLQQRSLAISICFYTNLLGFAFGAIFTTTYISQTSDIQDQMLILAIITTTLFILSAATIKNHPKKIKENIKPINLRQFRYIWKNIYNTYTVVMTSVFLGVSWSFLSSINQLQQFFGSTEISILIAIWVISGSLFGLIMSGFINNYVSRSGKLYIYDNISYIILFIGMIGYVIIGICYQYKIASLVVYIFLMIFIGIGSIGFYGLMFLSLVQSYYPINSLIIGSIITVGASLYGGLTTSLGQFLNINIYFIMAAITFLPFIYVCFAFKTNFKRYIYYRIDDSHYDLINLDDYKSLSNNQTGFINKNQ